VTHHHQHKPYRLTIRFDERTWQRLHYRAAAEGLPVSTLIREDLAAASKRWRPPTPSTSGLSIRWPDDVPAPASAPALAGGDPLPMRMNGNDLREERRG